MMNLTPRAANQLRARDPADAAAIIDHLHGQVVPDRASVVEIETASGTVRCFVARHKDGSRVLQLDRPCSPGGFTVSNGRGLAQRTIDLRTRCHDILNEIQPATVRAVCYRLFVAKAIPDMHTNSTAKISRILTRAREDGMIPWEWIVDETRELERASQWSDPESFANAIRDQYRRDLWDQQPRRLEVWSEKGTMRGTLRPILDAYGVGFRVMHGFGSATAMMDIAAATQHDDVPRLALYLGDWDPSGMHMSKVDIPARLTEYGARVEVIRLALTADDLDRPDLVNTSFPAADKRKDPRYRWFVETIGPTCWELDALSPVIIRDRIERAIRAEIDIDRWNHYKEIETLEVASLNDVMDAWERLKAS